MNIQLEERNKLRQIVRANRQAITQAQQSHYAKKLCNCLTSNPKISAAKRVALYLTNDGELDTTPLIKWCWQHNIQVFLPVIHPFSKGHLLFLKYDVNTPMKENNFGILEPVLDVRHIVSPADIDVICTPLVAFDSSGNRMGMGGGFYDRTLANWHLTYQQDKKARPYPIGLAHDCQQVDSIPSEAWDIPLPELYTPTQHFIFS